MAHSCFAEVVVPEKKNSSSGGGLSGMGHTSELEEAVRSWRGAAEVTLTLGRSVPFVQIGEAPEGLCLLVLKKAFLCRSGFSTAIIRLLVHLTVNAFVNAHFTPGMHQVLGRQPLLTAS